ncbi:MAG: DUF4097 family beta strand repeat-containing protein [Cyclobacteriaceae bacterium]
MKKQILYTLFGIMISTSLWAQEYKVAKSTGKLDIKEVGDVSIVGYTGKEVIFSSRSYTRDRDDRAKGLRAVSSMGLEDNTGLGLSVVDNNGTIEIRQLRKMNGPDVIIKVPQGMVIKYAHTSPHGSDLKISDVAGEIDVSTVHNDVELENVTGIVRVRTVHGDINASFAGEIKNVVSISSTHGHVDVALPASTKGDLKLSTTWGEIFVDPALNLEMNKSGDFVRYSDRMEAKLNGGGTEISLSSTHDNVYLRKK